MEGMSPEQWSYMGFGMLFMFIVLGIVTRMSSATAQRDLRNQYESSEDEVIEAAEEAAAEAEAEAEETDETT